MPDILRHLQNTTMVRGGAMLGGDRGVRPVLCTEEFLDPGLIGREPLSASLDVESRRGRVRRTGNSAEAIRALKAAHGVPARPTNEPVDIWGKNGDAGA